MPRFFRRHAVALIALMVYNFVFFFPVAFFGRAVSPNDVFYNSDPWALYRPAGVVRVQNSLLNDPPTAYYTLFAMLRRGGGTFHWNPYVACGIPGFGSSAAAVLSPFVLLPLLLVPLTWVWTAIVFLKLNVAFLFAYGWLREERLGRAAAAAGAIVVAGAGIVSVRWLWQMTNAMALYPALLWLVRRAFANKRTPVWLTTLVALAYALAGFPAAMAYGAYLAAAYALYLTLRNARRGIRAASIGSGVVGVLLALMIAAPSLVPFVQLLRRSGYLPARAAASAQHFPLSHWRSFFVPERLGNPATKNWSGDPALGIMNNYVEATVYVGVLTIALALFAPLSRRAGTRRFWIVAALVVLAAMFGFLPWLGRLPGFRYSTLARVSILLPAAAGYLAAAGTAWLLGRARRGRAVVAFGLVIALAAELAVFAGRFHPYLDPADAEVPVTPTLAFLQSQPGPFRIAPFFNYFWPNAAELFAIEDVRSHFGSEEIYRRMLQRLDPSVWSGTSTVLQFNSLTFDFDDPLAGMLGIRWYIEQKSIDIIRWTTFKKTVPGVRETGTMPLLPGALMRRPVRVEALPFYAIELPCNVEEARGRAPRLVVSLEKNGAVVWSRAFPREHINLMSKVYIPLGSFATLGETVTLQVRSIGLKGWMLQAADGLPFYGRVTTPVVFDRELPDGRLFRNLAEVPRFHPVRRLRKLNDDELLAARDIDFEQEAVITDDPVMPPPVGAPDARVRIAREAPDEQRLATDASASFFLASSEKLTPELRIAIDGRPARPIEINALFAGVVVPAGRHEVVFTRRIARGWWWVAALGAAFWLGSLVPMRRNPSSVLHRAGHEGGSS